VLDLVPGLRELARAQLGVVRRDQLRTLGVTHDHVRTQVRAQRWTAIGPRVVVLSRGALTRAQRRAVGLAHAGPSSVLAGLTALEVHGLRDWERDDIHVLVPHGLAPPRLPGVVVHQTHHLDPHDLAPTTWPPFTTAAKAAVDAASWERSPRTASGRAVAVVRRRLATAYDVLEALERPGRLRHRTLLRSVLAESAGGAESVAEVDVGRMLRRVGLDAPQRQVVLETAGGPRRVDLTVRLPDGRTLAIEIDGPHHEDPRQREDDAAKDAALVAAGYVVLHIPVSLLRRSPATVLAQLQAIADAARRRART
jgi:very-short-patch-repair endonuclease